MTGCLSLIWKARPKSRNTFFKFMVGKKYMDKLKYEKIPTWPIFLNEWTTPIQKLFQVFQFFCVRSSPSMRLSPVVGASDLEVSIYPSAPNKSPFTLLKDAYLGMTRSIYDMWTPATRFGVVQLIWLGRNRSFKHVRCDPYVCPRLTTSAYLCSNSCAGPLLLSFSINKPWGLG